MLVFFAEDSFLGVFLFEFPSLALLFISLLDRMQPVRDASLTSLLKKRSCLWFKKPYLVKALKHGRLLMPWD